MEHRTNYITYAPEAILVPVIILVAALVRRSVRLGLLGLVLLVGSLAFYRGAASPCEASASANKICSPCEGRVLAVERRHDYICISTFLGIHNVHVQYAPIDGEIISVTHKPGEFNPAYFFEKSRYNERVETVIRPRGATAEGDIKVIQIAGQIARRIVPFRDVGEKVSAGEPLGLIKFGSRVDVIIPRWLVNRVLVSEGDRVRIGDSIAILHGRG